MSETDPARDLARYVAVLALVVAVLALVVAVLTLVITVQTISLGRRSTALAPASSASARPAREALILSINDTYRVEGVYGGAAGGFARVRTLRKELEAEHPDLLLLHAGDLFFPSLLSRMYQGKQMVDGLNLLDGKANTFDPRLFVTFGNHEFDQPKMIVAVTTEFLVNPAIGNRDGYTFEVLGPTAEGGELLDLVRAALQAAGEAGIAPRREGQICNTADPPPCLSVQR